MRARSKELEDGPPGLLASVAGVPRADGARALLEALARELWPAAAA